MRVQLVLAQQFGQKTIPPTLLISTRICGYSLMRLFDDLFGQFHLNLIIGPYFFDFSSLEISFPRYFRTQSSLLVLDLGEVDGVEAKKIVLENIYRMNTQLMFSSFYSKKSDDNPFLETLEKKNCHAVVFDILKDLNLFQECVSSFRSMNRKFGRLVSKTVFDLGVVGKYPSCNNFTPSERFCRRVFQKMKNHKNSNKDKTIIIWFKNHSDLDKFVIDCVHQSFEDDIDQFGELFPDEFIFLKSLDRSFWLRENYEKKKLKGGEQKETLCPFGDPFSSKDFISDEDFHELYFPKFTLEMMGKLSTCHKMWLKIRAKDVKISNFLQKAAKC